jgi:hypothetical protein
MINEHELNRALKTKDQTYNLVMWLNSAIKKDIIIPQKAIEYTTSFDAAKDWIVEHYKNLPIDSRPDSLDFKDVDTFTYMFLSHFNSSFDIETEPGQRYVPHLLRTVGIFVDNPHIHPKKLYARDKLNARKLKIEYLQGLAIEHGIQFDNSFFENLVDDCELKEKIAITTYGLQLIERLKGFDQGIEVLALWREFAWDSNGSPKKKFKLEPKLILEYEKLIINELNKKSTAHNK